MLPPGSLGRRPGRRGSARRPGYPERPGRSCGRSGGRRYITGRKRGAREGRCTHRPGRSVPRTGRPGDGRCRSRGRCTRRYGPGERGVPPACQTARAHWRKNGSPLLPHGDPQARVRKLGEEGGHGSRVLRVKLCGVHVSASLLRKCAHQEEHQVNPHKHGQQSGQPAPGPGGERAARPRSSRGCRT